MGEVVEKEQVSAGLELPGVEDPAWLRVMELCSLSCLPVALKAVINLNVLNILAKHPHMLSAAQIVSHTKIFPSSNPTAAAISLDRILRVLASHGVLTSSLDHSPHMPHTPPLYVTKYGLNDISKYLLHSEHGDTLAPWFLLSQDRVFMDSWQYFDEALLDGGEPFTKAHAKDAFLYATGDLHFNNLFNAAMANQSKLLIQSLLDVYLGFDDVTTLVDVGGGLGASLSMIISKHPHIKGINFDQPHVIAGAPEYPGVDEHVGGDMFVSIPEADGIFMKSILHNWSDEHCVEILKNCYKALPKNGGKVIMMGIILPSTIETGARARLGYHFDMMMLAYHKGGQERTHEELLTMSKLAGFERMHLVTKVNEFSLVELYKM